MMRPRIWYSAFAIFTLTLSATFAAKAEQTTSTFVKEFTITANGIDIPQIDLEQNAKQFTFDWNHGQTIARNKDKIANAEKVYKEGISNQNLTDEDKVALGKLAYKLGTYYLHVLQEPDQAIEKLNMASKLLTKPQNRIWINDNLAYAYAKKFEANHQTRDLNQAYQYLKAVNQSSVRQTNADALGFAYYVRGYMAHDRNQFDVAEKNYRIALTLYQKNADVKDNDTYIRIQNRLAHSLLHDGQDTNAIRLLQTVKNEWISNGNVTNNPYAARNFIDLGEAYLKTGNTEAAGNELTDALKIYQNVYGQKSEQLRYPYHLLSYTYSEILNSLGIDTALPQDQLLSGKICSTLLTT